MTASETKNDSLLPPKLDLRSKHMYFLDYGENIDADMYAYDCHREAKRLHALLKIYRDGRVEHSELEGFEFILEQILLDLETLSRALDYLERGLRSQDVEIYASKIDAIDSNPCDSRGPESFTIPAPRRCL